MESAKPIPSDPDADLVLFEKDVGADKLRQERIDSTKRAGVKIQEKISADDTSKNDEIDDSVADTDIDEKNKGGNRKKVEDNADDHELDKRFHEEKQGDNDESTVDEMKIQTMYKMVEDVNVVWQGKDTTKKVVYLTNKQALLFDEGAVARCIQALDLGEPKFAIMLLPSTGVESQMKIAHKEKLGKAVTEYKGSQYTSSELCHGDARIVEEKILVFMKTCILPLAIQTRAVIIISGANDCILGAALSNVVLAEQARLGKDCPFTVVATVLELEIHSRANSKKSSLAYQIARGSRSWFKRMPKLHEFLCPDAKRAAAPSSSDPHNSSSGAQPVFPEDAQGHPASDVDVQGQAKGSAAGAQPTIGQPLADARQSQDQVPSAGLPEAQGTRIAQRSELQHCDLTSAASHYIIFESVDIGDDGGLVERNPSPRGTFIASFVQSLTRKLPSIAIQSHAIDQGLESLSDMVARNIPVLLLDNFERALTCCPAEDENFKASTKLAKVSDAFPLASEILLGELGIEGCDITPAGRLELLNLAKQMMERKWDCYIIDGACDSLETSTLAFLHSALVTGAKSEGLSDGENVALHARIHELERLSRSNKDSGKAKIPPELVTSAVDFIETRAKALRVQSQKAKAEKWINENSERKEKAHLIEEAKAYLADLEKRCEKIKRNDGLVAENINPTRWLPMFELLSSPNTFSGSLHDLEGLKRILSSVAQIDRLPPMNSLEALKTLREAWDHVEVYHQWADAYKAIAKVTYILLLITGALMTAFSLAECQVGWSSKTAVLVLSFVASAYITFTNPATRWQSLRMAALSIESNIWTFRTRSGPYRSHGVGEDARHSPEALFAAAVQEIKDGVLEGADIKTTSLFSSAPASYGHGQHSRPGEEPPHETTNKWRTAAPATKKAGTKGGAGGADPSKGRDKARGKGFADRLRSAKIIPVPSFLEDIEAQLNVNTPVDPKQVRLHQVVAWLRRNDSAAEAKEDRHYSPVQPEAYIRFRVKKSLDFYRRRIPGCHRVRVAVQTLLVCGSLGAGALAFADRSVWCAAIAILTSGLSAYVEFQGTNTKISRYSSTVHALQRLLFWWSTLPQIDRSVVENIDRLVMTCEEVLAREQQAWRATSQAVRMLGKHRTPAPPPDTQSSK